MTKLPALQDLYYFTLVAQMGSLTRAADQLDMSTAALSKAMKRLEDNHDVRLFKRSARAIVLTEAGQRLRQHSQAMLERWHQCQQELTELSEEIAGTVVINSSAALAGQLIVPLLPALKHQYPKLVIDLRLDDRYIDLKQGEVDLLIRVGLLNDEEIIARPLMPLDMIYGASPAYLAGKDAITAPQDLKHHATIGFRLPASNQLMPYQFQQANHLFSIELQHDVIVNSPDVIQSLVLADQGIGLLGRHLAQSLIDRGELIPVLADWMPQHERGIFLCYLDRQWMPKKMLAVVEFLLEKLSG
ncbi:hypothetical protein BTA51_09805 [Hahella sp. CCB-MM4]|uniref:LysR family transcriptional regulator n=1 Tax=Hahella sp. (strain CCB-MM4) TaxID=1926491 RepID=UPI000B9AB846|nr:LysR family transcriptional regulator [Hahella sp. CCB-MM4]OZG74056.1 hypothetical protein BTA51_09805 [Hahella sp. CCB-MM4]